MPILQSRARKTRGFTLTEAAIVLGIVGLILGAIWVAAAAVYENMRTNRANEQILKVAQAVRSLYASSPTMNVGGENVDVTTALVSAGIFPTDMLNGTTVYHPWDNSGGAGGANSVIVSGYDSTPPRFAIKLIAAPKQACMRIMTGNTGQQRDAGMYAVGIAQAAGADPEAGGIMYTNFPVSVTTADGTCTDPDPGVALVFKLKP